MFNKHCSTHNTIQIYLNMSYLELGQVLLQCDIDCWIRCVQNVIVYFMTTLYCENFILVFSIQWKSIGFHCYSSMKRVFRRSKQLKFNSIESKKKKEFNATEICIFSSLSALGISKECQNTDINVIFIFWSIFSLHLST